MLSHTAASNLPTASTTPREHELLAGWAESGAFVYCRDFSGLILAANRSFARRFGFHISDLTHRPIATLLHQEDAAVHSHAEELLARAPHQATSTSRWLTPQGWRWIEWEESTAVHGGLCYIRAIGHDVTRQRAAEEHSYKLSRAVEQCPVGIVITDAQGNVQYVNAKFTDVTGYTLEQLLDRPTPVLREGHPDEESFQRFWECVQAGREWRGELHSARPDGTQLWESVQVSCLRNSAGEITHLLSLREDITARKALEDQLRQAQKMESLGTMAGGIAHDFNNIIAVINGYAELAMLNLPKDDPLEKSLLRIRNAARRATGLVRQILTFSRKAEVRFAPLDLNNLVREILGLLGETFPRNITCNLALRPGLPPLLADQNQIQQVILNLCVNARDAMPAGGALTLATSVVEGDELPKSILHRRPCACLTITDTGIGMSLDVRERIFEPFFTTKPVHQGTGLGLAVVYGIVTAHEGLIEVASAPGIGSTFSVYLPLSEIPLTNSTAIRSCEFPSGNESVLVVDDEVPLCELLQSALTSRGYRVACAMDGLEAIEKLGVRHQHYDVMLLDLNMPGASGLEVARRARINRPDMPIIVLTGHLSPEARAELEACGCRSFVTKPYALHDLGRMIREVLADARHV